MRGLRQGFWRAPLIPNPPPTAFDHDPAVTPRDEDIASAARTWLAFALVLAIKT